MNIQNIEVIFEDYLKADKTQYAILLNGSWGSGKTYFLKNNLEKVANRNGFNTIYISLNGISSIDSLQTYLFLKLIPILNKKENIIIKNTKKLIGKVVDNLSKAYLKSSLTDLFKDVTVDSFDFSKYIICFDDLERCQVPIKEVLGYINNFVEHKNVKTLILSDESKIDKNQIGYHYIKEKVIGRVLNLELNIETTLPYLFEKFKIANSSFYNFLIIQKKVLIDIFEGYGQENLRIINFYLTSLEKLFTTFNKIDQKYIQEVIFFSALISIEFKKGHITSENYNYNMDLNIIDEKYHARNFARTSSMILGEEGAINTVKPYVEIFYETYLTTNFKLYFFYNSIYIFILTGYLNVENLLIEIRDRYPKIILPEIQDFNNLISSNFRDLSDIDFKRLSENVIQYALEGKYSIYDYPQLLNFLYYFSKNNLIQESIENIDKILYEGLNIAKTNTQPNDYNMENLMRFGDDFPAVTKIKYAIKEIHSELKKAEFIIKGNLFIEYLVLEDETLLLELLDKNQFSEELFQYIDDKLFLETILKISNKRLVNFTDLIKPRYNTKNIGDLYEDRICLTKLRDSLSNYFETNEEIAKLKKFLLLTLKNNLTDIVEKLEISRSK